MSSLVSITLNYMNSVFRLVFRKCVFKEIVHPTMIVVPNLYEFLLLNTKEDILKNAGNQTFDSAFTSIVFLYLLWKSMGTRNCLVLQNIFSCVQHKKETYRYWMTWGWVSADKIIPLITAPEVLVLSMNKLKYTCAIRKNTLILILINNYIVYLAIISF